MKANFDNRWILGFFLAVIGVSSVGCVAETDPDAVLRTNYTATVTKNGTPLRQGTVDFRFEITSWSTTFVENRSKDIPISGKVVIQEPIKANAAGTFPKNGDFSIDAVTATMSMEDGTLWVADEVRTKALHFDPDTHSELAEGTFNLHPIENPAAYYLKREQRQQEIIKKNKAINAAWKITDRIFKVLDESSTAAPAASSAGEAK
jgi:hypothetical protein